MTGKENKKKILTQIEKRVNELLRERLREEGQDSG